MTRQQVKIQDKIGELCELRQMFMNFRELISFCLRRIFQTTSNILFNIVLNIVKKTQREELSQVSIGQSGLRLQRMKELKCRV
jgi:hypothetical protein